MKRIKVCLHNHTDISRNSINTIEDFRKVFNDGKLDKLAITDHNSIVNAKKFQSIFGEDKIIIGEEISTKDGDIIGLFLKKFVPSGLSAQRTCEHIIAQGGIILAPHILQKKGLQNETLEKIRTMINVVEGYNGWRHKSLARPFLSNNVNEKSKKWAQENNIPFVANSDSHYRTDIANSYTIIDDFSDAKSFIDSLKGELELVENKNKVNLLSARAWVKGRFGRDLLKRIK